MAFPIGPTAGDTYTAASGVTYEYTALGTWKVQGGAAAAVTVTSWTTVGRPAAPTVGQQGFNTDLDYVEVWDGAAWVQVGGASGGSNGLVYFIGGNS